jgi:hypothetical protein
LFSPCLSILCWSNLSLVKATKKNSEESHSKIDLIMWHSCLHFYLLTKLLFFFFFQTKKPRRISHFLCHQNVSQNSAIYKYTLGTLWCIWIWTETVLIFILVYKIKHVLLMQIPNLFLFQNPKYIYKHFVVKANYKTLQLCHITSQSR